MKRIPCLYQAFSLFLLCIPLFIAGCSQDEEDSVPVSRVGDLVGFQVSVDGISSDAGSLTRGFWADTVRFTHELGDGLVMETALAPERNPVTRSAVSSALTHGAKVLMLAYRDGSLYKYQILTNQNAGNGLTSNPFTIWLPVPGNFKLVFYSLNSTGDINIEDYLNGGTYTAIESDGATYGWLISGNPKLMDPSVKGGTSDTNGTDAICAMLNNLTLTASSNTLPAVTFKHLFSRVSWTLISKDNGKYVTGCTASFGPTAANATVNMGTLVSDQSNLGNLWTNPSPTIYTNKTLIPFGNLSGNTQLTVASAPCVFIPTNATSSSSTPLSISLSSLAMDGSEVISGQKVNITGVGTALQPGTSYTMSSNVSYKGITVRLRGSDDFLAANTKNSSAGGTLTNSVGGKASKTPISCTTTGCWTFLL